jgi:uncharacterized DUF497 family protein
MTALIMANGECMRFGLVNGLEITVIYTDREREDRRIILAWRAEPQERRHYWKNIEGEGD